METVFDYNITDEEREYIGITEKEDYLLCCSEESANFGLANLFWHRGDKKKAGEYADRLSDCLKWDFYRTMEHP